MRCESLPRAGWVVLVALTLACGDYSNVDLEYFSALPTREDIKSNLPEEEEEAGLRVDPGVESALRAALGPPAADTPVIGQRAKLYTDTQGAANLFKAIAEVFVRLVDGVQRHPATSRDENSRTWGPFPLRQHPGFDFRVVIARDPAAAQRFNYAFAFRPEGGDDAAWQDFFTGHFIRGGDGRGIGSLLFDNAILRDNGLQTNMELDWLQIDYDARAFPHTVQLEFARLLDTFSFQHSVEGDGSGSMQFTFRDAFSATFDVSSRWNDQGSGRADATVSNFFGPLGTLSQCWNDAFLLTFHQSDFEAPHLLGGESACVVP